MFDAAEFLRTLLEGVLLFFRSLLQLVADVAMTLVDLDLRAITIVGVLTIGVGTWIAVKIHRRW